MLMSAMRRCQRVTMKRAPRDDDEIRERMLRQKMLMPRALRAPYASYDERARKIQREDDAAER